MMSRKVSQSFRVGKVGRGKRFKPSAIVSSASPASDIFGIESVTGGIRASMHIYVCAPYTLSTSSRSAMYT